MAKGGVGEAGIVNRGSESCRCVRSWKTVVQSSNRIRLWLAKIEIKFMISPLCDVFINAEQDIGSGNV